MLVEVPAEALAGKPATTIKILPLRNEGVDLLSRIGPLTENEGAALHGPRLLFGSSPPVLKTDFTIKAVGFPFYAFR